MTKMTLENFNDFMGEWLRPQEYEENQAWIIKDITSEDKQAVLVLEREGVTKKFGMNMTNVKAFMEFYAVPKEALGKKLYFKKIKTMRPSDKKEVDALRIENIV